MIGNFDEVNKGYGSDKNLVEELAIRNIIEIISNPETSKLVSYEQLEIIRSYLAQYIEDSTMCMSRRLQFKKKDNLD